MARRVIRSVIVLAIVAVGLVVAAPPAAACSCLGTSDAEALATADVAFSGTLVEVRVPPGETFSSMDPARFIFEVDRVYKGDARARQSVVTPRSGASCGLELSGPGPFLLFASTE